MNTLIRTIACTVTLAGLAPTAGCGATSSQVASPPAVISVAPASPAHSEAGRGSAAATTAAFAAAHAGGNTLAACALSTPRLATKMTSKGLCIKHMSWPEIPAQIVNCPITGGHARYVYQVDHDIQRFLLFGIKLTQIGAVRSVDQPVGHTPGDGDYGCSPPPNNGGG
jgi:hypothetical protein